MTDPQVEPDENGMPVLPTSEGQDHARRSIAEARDNAHQALMKFNAYGEIGNTVLVEREEGTRSNHVLVQAAVMGYRNLISKPYLTGSARDLWNEELATVPVPKKVIGKARGIEPVQKEVTETRGSYGDPIMPEDYDVQLSDFEMGEYTVGLDNLDWWHQREFTLELHRESAGSYGESATDRRTFRVVLPVHVLSTAFRQINGVFAELGEGIQPQESETSTQETGQF